MRYELIYTSVNSKGSHPPTDFYRVSKWFSIFEWKKLYKLVVEKFNDEYPISVFRKGQFYALFEDKLWISPEESTEILKIVKGSRKEAKRFLLVTDKEFRLLIKRGRTNKYKPIFYWELEPCPECGERLLKQKLNCKYYICCVNSAITTKRICEFKLESDISYRNAYEMYFGPLTRDNKDNKKKRRHKK